MSRRSFLKTAAAGAALSSATMPSVTIKVGVLHSLSGTMAISETALKTRR
jgi:urea transport system substrate-binding protein